MRGSPLTKEEASGVLLALVDTECWDPDVRSAAAFIIDVQHEAFTEYRFSGALGFGGKFWSANGKWYVSTYPEERTEERDTKIAQANVLLEQLRENHRGDSK